MEGYYCHDPAGVKQIMGSPYGLVQFCKLAVYFYSYGLKGPSRRVRALSAVRRGYGVFDYVRKLSGAVNGLPFPLAHYGRRHLGSVTFLAIVSYYPCQLPMTVSVYHIVCGKARPVVHSHIQRRFLMVGKAPLRGIQLIRRNPKIQKYAFHAGDALICQQAPHIEEVAAYGLEFISEGLQPFACCGYSLAIAVYSVQPAIS